LRQIAPQAVDDPVLERFIRELNASTLIRNIGEQHRTVAKTWNFTVRLRPDLGLQAIAVPASKNAPTRECWQSLPESFCTDVDNYLAWCAMPDPLDDAARVRALASTTRRLRRDHIHSAVTTAIAAGIDRSQLRSLANLVEVETYRTILRQRYADDGRTLSAYTHGIAGTLIAIAAEWAGVSAEGLAVLKKLRSKLGSLPSGLTEKNEALLRKFNDPRLVRQMLELPDRLWRQARRELVQSKGWAFVTLQTALALDILMHVPLRMQNLALLNFSKHLRWPQGVGKPAMVVFNEAETKNKVILEFELVAPLAERFRTYRDEIAPSVIGRRTDAVFVHASGKPRTQAALAVAIEKAILRHVGVRFTPHQFRHFAAKLILDENPGAIEQVRQMLGHENLKTTMNFYAGIDTRRAGRAHANLLIDLRAGALRRDPRKRRST
jgi:integrase